MRLSIVLAFICLLGFTTARQTVLAPDTTTDATANNITVINNTQAPSDNAQPADNTTAPVNVTVLNTTQVPANNTPNTTVAAPAPVNVTIINTTNATLGSAENQTANLLANKLNINLTAVVANDTLTQANLIYNLASALRNQAISLRDLTNNPDVNEGNATITLIVANANDATNLALINATDAQAHALSNNQIVSQNNATTWAATSNDQINATALSYIVASAGAVTQIVANANLLLANAVDAVSKVNLALNILNNSAPITASAAADAANRTALQANRSTGASYLAASVTSGQTNVIDSDVVQALSRSKDALVNGTNAVAVAAGGVANATAIVLADWNQAQAALNASTPAANITILNNTQVAPQNQTTQPAQPAANVTVINNTQVAPQNQTTQPAQPASNVTIVNSTTASARLLRRL